MIRKSFLMTLKPGTWVEYQKRHNPIWPELQEVLKNYGVHNYSIFLDPADGSLFGYAEIEDEARWAAIARTEVCRRWWHYMREVMPLSVAISSLRCWKVRRASRSAAASV